jgi:hypothetical protein
MLIQNGQGAQLIGRAPQGVASIFGSIVVSWCSRKQTFVALSTTEAEYIAICMAVREAMCLRKLLAGFFDQILDPTVIHYIRDMVQRKAVLVEYLPTDKQIADVLTEPLAMSKFEYFHVTPCFPQFVKITGLAKNCGKLINVNM